MKRFQAVLYLFIIMLLCTAASFPKQRAFVLSVADGDTIRVDFNSRREKVRLCGIDASESRPNQKALRDSNLTGKSVGQIIQEGTKATAFVKSLLTSGQVVFLEFDVEKRDKYGRLLAYVYLPDGKMLNALIVRKGHARAYSIPPNIRYQELFSRLQQISLNTKKSGSQ